MTFFKLYVLYSNNLKDENTDFFVYNRSKLTAQNITLNEMASAHTSDPTSELGV